MIGGASNQDPNIPRAIPPQGRSLKKLCGKLVAARALKPDLPLRLMFQDEARFGRMNVPTVCWAPHGIRPEVPVQLVREYGYVFGAVSPQDGKFVSLVFPRCDNETMSLHLDEISKRFPSEHVLIFMDKAAWHTTKKLVIPPNLTIDHLPPYSPQCNPQELVWGLLRREPFGNVCFNSMDDLEDALVKALHDLENSTETLQSLTSFPWIITSLQMAS